jgi:hypothetical protein
MLGIGLLVGALAPAQAQLVSVSPACNNAAAMTALTPDALDCSGAWAGNNLNQQANVLAQLQADFGGATWAYVGTSAGPVASGPFLSAGLGSTGTVNFTSPIYGLFAMALKASNEFSLYLFDGGQAGLSSITYTTIGSAINVRGIPQDLSHASLYSVAGDDLFTPDVVTATPEPASIVLMMTGLGAVALVRRRRRA